MVILYYTESLVRIRLVKYMCRNIALVGCLIIIVGAGCASSTRSAIGNVRLGMSTDEVLARVGEPVTQAELHPYQAWRYEYQAWRSREGDRPCGLSAGNVPVPCRQLCEHTTVWFNDNEVRSMTSILVDSMEECGKSAIPIIWEHMPEYVKRPDS